jgi:hypothetical protein
MGVSSAIRKLGSLPRNALRCPKISDSSAPLQRADELSYHLAAFGCGCKGFGFDQLKQRYGASGPGPSGEHSALQGMPNDELPQSDEQEDERQFDEFDRRYWDSSLVNGAIPICHEACALRIWLVLTGQLAGHLWRDTRADHTGLAPLRLADGSPATFSLWYAAI